MRFAQERELRPCQWALTIGYRSEVRMDFNDNLNHSFSWRRSCSVSKPARLTPAKSGSLLSIGRSLDTFQFKRHLFSGRQLMRTLGFADIDRSVESSARCKSA